MYYPYMTRKTYRYDMQRINNIILSNGIKKKWLAEQLNVDLSTFSGWLSGRRQPSHATIMFLLYLLKVDQGEVVKLVA
jgi:DNA-binding transcriptional regulator YiaG